MSIFERNIADWTPAPASVVARKIGQHEQLGAWMRGQLVELCEKHPDRWVATGTDRILIFGDNLQDVVKRVKASDGEEGVIVVRFLRSRPRVMIL